MGSMWYFPGIDVSKRVCPKQFETVVRAHIDDCELVGWEAHIPGAVSRHEESHRLLGMNVPGLDIHSDNLPEALREEEERDLSAGRVSCPVNSRNPTMSSQFASAASPVPGPRAGAPCPQVRGVVVSYPSWSSRSTSKSAATSSSERVSPRSRCSLLTAKSSRICSER